MSPKKYSLSVIVIAKNEEARIGKCLDAVAFAAQRIVLVNNSVDRTADVVKIHGATVLAFDSVDFAKLRNAAVPKVTGEWMLYVDADEIVTPQLASHIQTVIRAWSRGDAAGYEIRRKNYYLGKLWPKQEWMLRLFRKEAFIRWEGALHETPHVRGRIEKIPGDLLHDTHRTLSEMVSKTNEWSETEAKLRFAANHPKMTWWRLLRVVFTGFWDALVSQGGWRVGTAGWIESVYQGFSLFITYAKLWELQQKKIK